MRKIINLSLLTAIAVILHSIENLIPLPLGIRFGFANIISLIIISMYGRKEMVFVNVLRVILAGLLTGNIMSYPFYMSMGGIILSSVSLIIFSHTSLSLIILSVISALFHSIGQLLVLSFFVSTSAVLSYLFVMLLFSIPAGILNGLCAIEILKRLEYLK